MDNLRESIYPFLLKEYLIYLVYFFGISVLLLFIILIVHKVYTEKRAEKKKRLYDQYAFMLEAYLTDNSPFPEKPAGSLQYEVFADVCIDTLALNERDDADRVRDLLDELSAVDHFQSLARSSSWTKRYYAIEILGFFSIEELKGFFAYVMNNDTVPEVSSKAVWALSFIADKEDLHTVSGMLSSEISNSSKFNEYIFTNLIASYRRKGIINNLVEYLAEIEKDDNVPLIIKRDLLSACGSSGVKEAETVIARYFADYTDNPIIKIASIRALGSLESLASDITLAGLSDYDWRIRTVTAKAVHLDDEDIIRSLKKLLYDSFYSVRINASRKLASLGDRGLSALKSEADSEDRFVADTIRYIMAEMGEHD
jgi:HEAT repeat protein